MAAGEDSLIEADTPEFVVRKRAPTLCGILVS